MDVLTEVMGGCIDNLIRSITVIININAAFIKIVTIPYYYIPTKT